MENLEPKDHAEAMALFRSQVLGPLLTRSPKRGELACALQELCCVRFRPPGSNTTRTFGVSTLERWYYAYRRGGLAALKPDRRSDSGRAKVLAAAQRELLLDIRREHRSASVPLILRTLVTDGRLKNGEVSAATVRRLYAEHGLKRIPARQAIYADVRQRLRWEAERPGALWQGDVCHGPALTVNGKKTPLRIHALIDDASRFIVGIEAMSSERESDMLKLLVKALRVHGLPDVLYLDNGPTYTGDTLRIACARLGITLLHPRPRDPQAKGKIERFFRTLREGCLDHLGEMSSLHDVQVRLLAFISKHYHVAPHASLMGKSPLSVWTDHPQPKDHLCEERLAEALTVRGNRRLRSDSTVSVGGLDWQVDGGFLNREIIVVARSLVDPQSPPWIEHEEKTLPLRLVDPKGNAHRGRPKRHARPKVGIDAVSFDPNTVLLDAALGRKKGGGA
ncbi:MAG: DDE-type integrase/transposase/recombinase [Deltaproteobacteria bacterium]|nr:DDE-type integrase/transposase/recombinase [Deltaproteobacteria bacterium]